MAAERGNEIIAVEIKSFIGSSILTEFYRALGQFNLYGRALKNQSPNRILYLALPLATYEELSDDIFDFQDFEDLRQRFIIFEPIENTTLTWIK